MFVQVILFKDISLFNTALCFPYIAFILLLPFEIGPLLLMTISFSLGLGVDIFYDSQGLNAAACTFIAFIRPWWLSSITPRGGYEEVDVPKLKNLGFAWFFTYTAPLIFIHHAILFFVEAGGFHLFFSTLSNVFFSSVFTFFIIVISQHLFYRKTV